MQELYPENRGLKQGSYRTKFVFWKDHHGCNMEKGMECNKQEIERPQRKPSQRERRETVVMKVGKWINSKYI